MYFGGSFYYLLNLQAYGRTPHKRPQFFQPPLYPELGSQKKTVYHGLQTSKPRSQATSHYSRASAGALLPSVERTSEQKSVDLLSQQPHNSWFKLLSSQTDALSGQFVFQPGHSPKEACYEGSYLSSFFQIYSASNLKQLTLGLYQGQK